MKKITISVLITVAIVFSVVVLALACTFLIEIQNTPELLILEEVDVFPGSLYVVQTALVARWETYCTVIIACSCIAIVIGITVLCFINFLHPKDRASRTEARKAAKIAKLEQELKTLKKEDD